MMDCASSFPQPLQYLFIRLHSLAWVELGPSGNSTSLRKFACSPECLDSELLVGSSCEPVGANDRDIIGVRGRDCHISSRRWGYYCYAERNVIGIVLCRCIGSGYGQQFELRPVCRKFGEIQDRS